MLGLEVWTSGELGLCCKLGTLKLELRDLGDPVPCLCSYLIKILANTAGPGAHNHLPFIYRISL